MQLYQRSVRNIKVHCFAPPRLDDVIGCHALQTKKIIQVAKVKKKSENRVLNGIKRNSESLHNKKVARVIRKVTII